MSHLRSHHQIVLSLVCCLSLVWLIIWNFLLVDINFHSVVRLVHLLLSCCHILNVHLSEIFTTLHPWVVSRWIYFSYSFCIHLLAFVIKYWLRWIYVWSPRIQFNSCWTVLAHSLVWYNLVLKVDLVHWGYKSSVTNWQFYLLTLFWRCLMMAFLDVWLIKSILKCTFPMKIFIFFWNYIVISIVYIQLIYYKTLLPCFELCFLVRYCLINEVSTCVQWN